MSPDTGGLSVGQRLERIEKLQQDTLTTVNDLDARDRADLQRFAHHEARLSRLESSHIWLNRLVVGAVITAGIGLLFAGIGLGN